MPILEPRRVLTRRLQRLGGALMLGFGVVLVADVAHLVHLERGFQLSARAGAAVLIPCLLPVQFGWKLLSDPRETRGSLLGPATWRIGGGLIVLAAGLLAVSQLQAGAGLSWRLLEALGLAGVFFLKAQVAVGPRELRLP